MVEPMSQGVVMGAGPAPALPVGAEVNPASLPAEVLGAGQGSAGAMDSVAGMVPPPDPAAELPAPAPEDPDAPLIDALLMADGPSLIRRVYQLALSAARSKAQLDSAVDRLDPREYHRVLSAHPETRYAAELIAARSRLDALAQERRRLQQLQSNASQSQRPSTLFELQIGQINTAMEQVAGGVLLFLSMPAEPPAQ